MTSVMYLSNNVALTGEHSPAEISELCCIARAELQNSTQELARREHTRTKKKARDQTGSPGRKRRGLRLRALRPSRAGRRARHAPS